MKLYALKTDTGEWVNFFENGSDKPNAYLEPTDLLKRYAEKHTGHPCHWVEVQVIEAKTVTEEVMYNMNDFEVAPEWERGFRAACEYFGIKIQEDEK